MLGDAMQARLAAVIDDDDDDAVPPTPVGPSKPVDTWEDPELDAWFPKSFGAKHGWLHKASSHLANPQRKDGHSFNAHAAPHEEDRRS